MIRSRPPRTISTSSPSAPSAESLAATPLSLTATGAGSTSPASVPAGSSSRSRSQQQPIAVVGNRFCRFRGDAFYVLEQDLRQQLRAGQDLIGALIVGSRGFKRAAGPCQQRVGVSDDPPQEPAALFTVRPVDGDSALQALAGMQVVAVLAGPLFGVLAILFGQGADQQAAAVPDQVVGVPHRAPAQDGGGIDRQLHALALEEALFAGVLQGAAKYPPRPAVNDQLRAKQLQCGLGERAFFQLGPQRHLPAQVVVGPLLGLVVRDLIVGLQQENGGQQRGRHAGAAVVGAVEIGEIFVFEQLSPHARQAAVEGIASYVVKVQAVGLEEALLGMGPQHVSTTRQCYVFINGKAPQDAC